MWQIVNIIFKSFTDLRKRRSDPTLKTKAAKRSAPPILNLVQFDLIEFQIDSFRVMFSIYKWRWVELRNEHTIKISFEVEYLFSRFWQRNPNSKALFSYEERVEQRWLKLAKIVNQMINNLENRDLLILRLDSMGSRLTSLNKKKQIRLKLFVSVLHMFKLKVTFCPFLGEDVFYLFHIWNLFMPSNKND